MMNKQYDYRAVEQRIRVWWHDQQIYKVSVDTPCLVTIDTPPPTVSGSLHIGHIFSYTQTDIIARFLRMSGKVVWYPFGFDDNGLPTERFVEKKRGVRADEISRSGFIQLCLDETKGVEAAFQELWERIGLSVDWGTAYTTIGGLARKLSQESFIRLHQKGYVGRKEYPSLYCTTCRTTVAQAELDDQEEPSILYDIAFTDQMGQEYLIATTRPELLPACVAVLYAPGDERYQQIGAAELTVPFFGFRVPVIEDSTVKQEKGTGLVMCCTFGDTMDIQWAQRHNLPYRPAIGADGRWLPSTGPLVGKTARAARETVIEELKARGLLRGMRDVRHAVNVHERCRQPIEFLVIPQWFLHCLPYKDELVKLADQINWYPAFMKSRYIDWVQNISWDWCLSRQRFFGIPFPVWHCKACGEIYMASFDQLPIDPQETAWEGSCLKCGGGPVLGDTDVMDTWNTSSITPYLCAALRTNHRQIFDIPFEPMTMRPQAHDIIRTWAFYTIVKTWMHHGTVPWHDIVISGHVLSGSGGKLSKSKNNSNMEPEALLANYPADAVRFWTASGSLGHDIAFSEQQLRIGNKLVTKLWNAFLFITEHIPAQCTLDQLRTHEVHGLVHRWMGHQLTEAYVRYNHYFASYEFGLALEVVERLFWHSFCDNYLELIKGQLFNPERYQPAEVAESRLLLARYGLQILQLYAPFVPYITEELYQQIYIPRLGSLPTEYEARMRSLHTTHFALLQIPIHDTDAIAIMGIVMAIVTQMRILKTKDQLSLRTEFAGLIVAGNQSHSSLINEEAQALICGVTQSKRYAFKIATQEDKGLIAPHRYTGGKTWQDESGAWHALVVIS